MVDTQPTLEHLKLLNEVSQLLTSLDLNIVIKQVIDLMSDAVGAGKASLFLHDEHDIDWDHILLSRELDHDESVSVVRTVLDEGLAGWVVRNRQGAIVTDTQADPRWHFFADDSLPVRSALCVPFMYEGSCLAVLTLVHPEPHHFTESDLDLITIVANQAAVAIRTVQLFRQTEAQQRQLEIILRALPEILLVTDQHGRILQVNDEAQRIFGSGDSSLIGRSIHDFPEGQHPGHLLAPARHIIDKPPKSREPWPYDVRDEENGRDYQAVMTTWEQPAQREQGYVVIMHDVTNLRDLHRFKDEMLRVVSHDLRNPISLIMTARDMIEADMPPLAGDSHVAQYLDIIYQSTQRMESMIEELLTADTSSQQRFEPVQIALAVIERLRPLAERKGQTLEIDLERAASITIMADPLLISEAMENYLSNAVKYTPREGHIKVSLLVEDRQLHYIVEDNGIGIGAEHLPHLFEPYYRPPGTIEQGYGIGLNLVKTIVERHRGQVWVESEENVGSRFGFWLPM